MKLGLQGKQAVVTGSTAGIGLAIAAALAEEGVRVIINGRTEARVAAALDSLHQRNKSADVRGIAADLGNSEGVARFIEQVPEADILVNNLGIFETKPFLEIPDSDWVRFFCGERPERRPADPPFSSQDAAQELGPRNLYCQRIGAANPRGDDSLWRDQDRPGRAGARAGRIGRRHGCHRKFRVAGTHKFGRRNLICPGCSAPAGCLCRGD